MGVPVNPINEASGKASLKYFALQYFICDPSSSSTSLPVNQY
jgi:hypothetical protein